MKATILFLQAVFISTFLFGQRTDTLTFYSNAFQQERTVYIKTPEFYKYQSDSVRLPVLYILDGQHEWFVNPLVSTIRYLQYTHEIPQALVVIIPLLNRNQECGIKSLQGELPLHDFIVHELDEKLQSYHPNGYNVLIGHSFSASFALYSYLKEPGYYAAVMANSPFDSFEALIREFETNTLTERSKIFLSIGGKATDKDYYHRRQYDKLKSAHPAFFNSISLMEADQSSHNAVPIVAAPYLLTKIFSTFSSRYSAIATVDADYKLVTKPESIPGEIRKIKKASRIGPYFYPPEIPELNGLASRYLSSDLNAYGMALYEMGARYYPEYYEFHLGLYELLLPIDQSKSKWHLNKAYELLETMETDLPERQDILDEIRKEKKKNDW